jgi:DNA-binding Lrp family transcriptional regulator
MRRYTDKICGSWPVRKVSKTEATSWIFANCSRGVTNAISQIRRITTVESVTPVTGRFDLVIKLRTNNPAKAFNTVERIRGITGITSTQSAIPFQTLSSSRRETESPLGFTLLKVRGKVQNVLRRLKTIPNLLEAHILPGEFDVLASFKGYDPEELAETAVEKVNNITGVTTSETLVAYTPASLY